MSVRRLVPRLPAVAFAGQAEFQEYRREAQDRLDARHLLEAARATYDDQLVLPGTCAPCLRPASFLSSTAGWARRPDGRRLPDWSEGLVCDCVDRLSGPARALLHAALALGGLNRATRLLLFGPPHPSHRRLAAVAGETVPVPALRPDDANGFGLPEPAKEYHLAIAANCLHRVPPLDAAFAALRAALVPGGSLLFTVPFRPYDGASRARADLRRADASLPAETGEPAHELGWDILGRLRAAGFGHARAHNIWSAELGYLGPFHMIFHAAV